jgi:hypothetical protein
MVPAGRERGRSPRRILVRDFAARRGQIRKWESRTAA